jgi:hypothetical protein
VEKRGEKQEKMMARRKKKVEKMGENGRRRRGGRRGVTWSMIRKSGMAKEYRSNRLSSRTG